MSGIRVIAGKYKGRRLNMPKGSKIRPTADRVKEALFQVLGEAIEGKEVLELFAGSGSLGIEALSRGAKSVTFVDNNARCTKAIQENITQLQIPNPKSQIKTLQLDAFRSIRLFADNNTKFDIILLDPPYYKGLAKKCLNSIDKYGILQPLAFVVIEHSSKDPVSQQLQGLEFVRDYEYGDTVISIYECTQND